MNLSYIYSCIVILSVIYISHACKGCVNLDEFNFDKIIPRFEAALVKFDVAYPFGEKHDIFAKLASEIVNNRDFILGTVGVKHYGDKENDEFAKKYGISDKDDLPALKLFVRGEDEPFAFDKNSFWNDENIKKFVRDHTNIYLGLPGCLEDLDKLAMKFSISANKNDVLEETEKKIAELNEREKTIALTYIKFMKKVIENDESFISQEINRLEKILKSKVTDKKKEELSHRCNILKSFTIKPVKSEL